MLSLFKFCEKKCQVYNRKFRNLKYYLAHRDEEMKEILQLVEVRSIEKKKIMRT